MPLDRRGRPPAESRQPSIRRRIARDVDVEYVEHGLDWLAERVEPADADDPPSAPPQAPEAEAAPEPPGLGPLAVPAPPPGRASLGPPDAPASAVDLDQAPEPPDGAAPPADPAAAEPAGPPAAADQTAAAVTAPPAGSAPVPVEGTEAPDATPAREAAAAGGAGDQAAAADEADRGPVAAGPGPEATPADEASWFSPAVRALRRATDGDEEQPGRPPLPQAPTEPLPLPDPAPAPPAPAWPHPAPAPPAPARPHPAPAPPPSPLEQDDRQAAGRDDTPLPAWDDLTSDRLLARQPGGPTTGWQAFVYRLTGGRVRPRPSRAELARRQLEARVTTPVQGYRRIAVLALKGGVGKTTTTACLGATFAARRADRVVAVDASPDAGTLGGRMRPDGAPTAKDLLAGAPPLDRYADVRAYAAQTSSGLEVVASEMDPDMSDPFSDADYRKVAGVLERFYSLILTDCGPGVLHTVMLAVLERTDQIVVVSAPSVDGARSASLTLDWLERHGMEALARSAVVVVNSVRLRGPVNISQLEEHFHRRCRAVVRIPFDRHLETGAEIELGELAPQTRHAYLELAAAVADGFGDPLRARPDA